MNLHCCCMGSNVNPPLVHVTAPTDNFPRAAGSGPVRVHRRRVPIADVTVVDGLPTTCVARTIADCHQTGTDPEQLRLAVHQARKSGALSATEVELLERLIDYPAFHDE